MNYYTAPVEDLRSAFDYDGETGIFRNKSTGRKLGYQEPNGYVLVWFRGKAIRANRLAWALTHGEWPEVTIDHVNRNRSDNKIVNLRLATLSQNFSNTGISPLNTSGFKGVRFYKESSDAFAFIRVRGNSHYLGKFERAEDAAMAYDRAAMYFFGEFAATNYSLGRL
jgi:hypothetical protein